MGIFHQGIELGSTPLGAANPDIDILVSLTEALAGVAPQVGQLDLAVLVQGADASI